MSSDEKIARMTMSGVLTPEQAEALRHAADPLTAARGPSPHRRLPSGALLVGAGVAVVIALAVGLSGGDAATSVAVIQDVNQTINTPEGVGTMNRSVSGFISFIMFALPIVLGLLYFVSVYNGLVKREEGVYNAWADVESTYKRRTDLVPNLVTLVQGFMEHERATLVEVTDQRNNLGEAISKLVDQEKAASEALRSVKPESEEGLAELEQRQTMLMQSLRGVMATAEAYPTLRSADQFLALQAELEGTENRINIARQRFNDEVREFNAAARKLPGSLVASIGNFQRKAYFTTAATDEQPVSVKIGQ